MADNVQITQGTGTTVATDEIANVHYQQLKLTDGTLGSTTPIPGDGSGLSVQGQVASDTPVAGRPVLEGGRASDVVPTAVSADGDAVHAWRDRRGAAKTVLVDDNGDSAMDGTLNAVKVAVVTGSTANTEYSEGATVLSIVGQAMLWEDISDVVRTVSAAKPLPVNVITGSAAGTQYTEGDVDATITGAAVMWEDTSDTLRAASAAKPLPVAVITSPGGSVLPDPIVAANGTAVPLKGVSVNATADGDNTVVAAVATKKLRVLGYMLQAATATVGTIQFRSGGATTIGRARFTGDGTGASYPGGVDAMAFETAAGEALVINNPAGIDTIGHLTYIEV